MINDNDNDDIDNIYAPISALTFSKCSLFYSIQNDHKLIRSIKLNKIFDNISDFENSCFDIQITDNIFNVVNNNDINISYPYDEYEDSLIALSAELNQLHSISNEISDIAITNKSTLLITQKIKQDSYYENYRASLIHIPFEYQYNNFL